MTISLILPYWDRPAAAARGLASVARCYGDLDLEVVVVDDGTPAPFAPPNDLPGMTPRMTVVRLPTKTGPLSPVTPWNIGAAAATGDWLALSCIEVIHETPVLDALAQAAGALGPKGIALAAAWCPEMAEWHCHSTHRSAGAPALPEGTGRPFCAVLHRSLYEAVGGFDEAFRAGAGYEDMDFINRLLAAGARFQIRDDLVVTHPKTDARIHWPPAMFARNRALYEARWGQIEEARAC